MEVLSKKEMPSGSWCCAKIICGNGHNYTVRYDGFEGASDKAAVERVPRNAIRPCPPPLEVSENWVPGDLVEVFDNFSWKMATISKVLGKQYFLVRLLGSSQEFKVRKFEIRVRQFWQDDKWVVIGKVMSSEYICLQNIFIYILQFYVSKSFEVFIEELVFNILTFLVFVFVLLF